MKIEAYAKVNFTLDVYGTRPDGYHALRSVVMPISLADTLEIETTAGGSITSDTGYDDDLCVKAARVLRSQISNLKSQISDFGAQGSDFGAQISDFGARGSDFGAQVGVSIHVTKRIPAGGGLGGGSADAAAVLRALNELWELELPLPELAEIGAQVGSDVPALVLGGAVLMEGRGERVQDLRLKTGDLNLVLVNPGVHSSTREVYAACRAREKDASSPTDAMVAAMKAGDFAQIVAATSNDLQAPAVKLHPEIADALTSLRTAGATGVTMSGSGSCVFGFAPDSATAERISADLNFRGLQSWPVTTRLS